MLRLRFFEIALVLVRLGQLSAAYCSKSRTASESNSVALLKKEKPTKLDRSQFTDEELAFIDLYHRICLPIGVGFLSVTERSEELDKVLDVFAPGFDEKQWIKSFREAVQYRREVFKTHPRKYNTLVQICWKLNY